MCKVPCCSLPPFLTHFIPSKKNLPREKELSYFAPPAPLHTQLENPQLSDPELIEIPLNPPSTWQPNLRGSQYSWLKGK